MKKKLIILSLVFVSIFTICQLAACTSPTSSKTDYDIVKQTKMDNFTLLNNTAEHGQIVMCGDSIVELYPQELMNNHNQNSPKIVFNRGISGDTTVGLKRRFTDNVLKINPSIISILIGTNDLAIGLSLDEVVSNLKQMIDQAKAAGVNKIIIQSIYPVNYSINKSMVGARNNKDIEVWNEKLIATCEDTGAVYADIGKALKDSDGNFKKEFTYDGLHPNAVGYLEINKLLKEYFFN